ncbi:MAG: sigma-54 dependent transcriptional regulator [Planctomycetota bacterium]|jgi:DNA-binding NtrC family response regulator|nr:DNA-binding response regulator [Planctomycetota bacterium]MDP6839427.1 sigma-54 dependent transcriptional regulator [Planctomycetota bacterium]MDP6955233.1 sigma-54 dependent transcriptional regulator [Planctomycetota bacterium]
MRILLAEDEPTIVVTLGDALRGAGHSVFDAPDTDTALEFLEGGLPNVVLTDIRMPGAGGMAVLARALELAPERPVIVMTGYGTVDQAVEAMRLGARNYVQKPFRNEAILAMVEDFGQLENLREENRGLRERLSEAQSIAGIVGASPEMEAVFERIRKVAPTEATVLIEGESGTGKERVARALHGASGRAQGPFIPISCAALPETLLEAELFGHEKGAFTDARRERRGRFELADGGTLFLDDIDDMPLAVQVKLLRVLQERSFERVGGERQVEVDIRVLAATKVPLQELVNAGKFREDLFYRIHVVPLSLPPLRARAGDVPLLLTHFIAAQARRAGGEPQRVSRSTLVALTNYPWPGNVRELENAVQRAVALAGDKKELALEDLVTVDPRWRGALKTSGELRPLREVVREHEVEHIRRALVETGGHRTQTADILGISRKVLWEKIRDFKIEVPERRGRS